MYRNEIYFKNIEQASAMATVVARLVIFISLAEDTCSCIVGKVLISIDNLFFSIKFILRCTSYTTYLLLFVFQSCLAIFKVSAFAYSHNFFLFLCFYLLLSIVAKLSYNFYCAFVCSKL